MRLARGVRIAGRLGVGLGAEPRTMLLLAVALGAAASGAFARAANAESLEAAARSPRWLRLLHIKHAFPFGAERSEAEPGAFFLSPTGRADPLAELAATRAAFRAGAKAGRFGVDARCAFPARLRFVREVLGDRVADAACPELEAYLERMGGDALSVVFSSAYPNSPPSMFGHTLLRVSQRGREALLDFGVNYAAAAGTDENAIAFAILGLTGGYAGQFGVVPYYLKVNEYNHAESRDLWEYELALSRDEIRTVLLHLWELDQNAVFRYYFFDENCSYRILTLLEAARPDWDLSRFAVAVFPAETIKRLTETPGAVREVRYRPSLRTQMLTRFAGLSGLERARAMELIAGRASPTLESPTLEAALSYFQFRRLKGDGKLPERERAAYARLLSERARRGAGGAGAEGADPVEGSNRASVGVPSAAQNEGAAALPSTRPDLGHGAYLAAISGGAARATGAERTRAYGALRFKTAYHDLLDADAGYIVYSQIDFPELELRFAPEPGEGESALWIERLGLVNVTSLFPITALERQLSWHLDISYRVAKDLACASCHAVGIEAGAGAASEILAGRALVYALVVARFEAGTSLANGVRGLPEVRVAALATLAPRLKASLEGSATWDVAQSARPSHFFGLRAASAWTLAREWQLRARAEAVLPADRQNRDAYRELGLGVERHF
jgi:hypothetical protein